MSAPAEPGDTARLAAIAAGLPEVDTVPGQLDLPGGEPPGPGAAPGAR